MNTATATLDTTVRINDRNLSVAKMSQQQMTEMPQRKKKKMYTLLRS